MIARSEKNPEEKTFTKKDLKEKGREERESNIMVIKLMGNYLLTNKMVNETKVDLTFD